ncbi:MAG: chymotrypsin family serine protease [Bacillota bacterium]
MKEFKRVLEANKQYILSLQNVVGVGIGYKEVRGRKTNVLAIKVLVSQKIPLLRLDRRQMVPSKLDKISTDVIEVGAFRMFDRTSRERPASPGLSLGHFAITAGTFGAVVKDKATGDPLILSNNHVLANITNGQDGRSSIGDAILQPGAYDGGRLDADVIARLERFVPLRRMVEESTCPWAAAAIKASNAVVHTVRPNYRLTLEKKVAVFNLVDAAVARPVNREMIKPQIMELGEVAGMAEAELGMEVVKSGRTSGVTKGVVEAVEVTMQVMVGPDDICVFTEQIMTSLVSRPGDSGSLIIGKDHQAVGLLFAGSEMFTSFNRIQRVAELLQITF